MRPIDADELIKCLGVQNADKYNGEWDSFNTLMKYEIKWEIDDMPTLKPIRCGECKRFLRDGSTGTCSWLGVVVLDDFSCIDAIRKGDDE